MPKLSPRYRMPFRRRREGKTNYKKRLKLLYSKKPRLVFRKSLKYIYAQVIRYEPAGDKTVVGLSSKVLKKFGWNYACDNTPAAYLTGLLIGKKAIEKGIKEVVLDIGLYHSTKGGRAYALAKGAIEAGLSLPVDERMFPSEERIKGKHISEQIEKSVDEIKKRIIGEKNA